ncbi:Armadillo-type fold [Pseudocohnilembus persalinus]|uniref:Armadillo-type fold n=1 Tax=Pseudocohnilembus persalinus TaxID=266149 RepID=A0A0V0QVH2_PSEPJ|nr:Armadillo-type fold [Pseudocohnilembus persalinus]|eukprot:KRX06077.1 Armadillo-type fold [Pseudocohnilembus persalinus]
MVNKIKFINMFNNNQANINLNQCKNIQSLDISVTQESIEEKELKLAIRKKMDDHHDEIRKQLRKGLLQKDRQKFNQEQMPIQKIIELGFFNVLRGLLISPICQYINPVEKVIFEYQDDQGLKNYDNLNNNNEVFDESKQMNQDQNTYLTQQQNNHANFKKFNSRILKQILITYELFFEKCPDEFKLEIYDSQLIKIIKSNVINQSHQSLRQHSVRLLLLLVKQKPEQIIEICLQQKIFKILISNGQKEDQIVKKSILLLFKNVICKFAKPNQVYRLILEFNLFSLLNYFLDQDTLVNLLYDTLIIIEKIFQIGFQYYFNQITKSNQFIDEFESKFNSQIFEQLQFHKNDHIYEKSLAIVEQEGHIGIYTRGGALIDGFTEPGLHFKFPLITSINQVQVTIQTDQVQNIPCGTASGVLIYFDKIEVVNRLKKERAWETIQQYTFNYDQTWIFDKIHHEINQFCSKHTLQEILIDLFDQLDDSLQDALQKGCQQWAPGIEIISVRVTKPRIPNSIAQNYINSEAEKSKLLISYEKEKIIEEEAQINKQIQRIEAETKNKIQEINSKSNLLEQEYSQKIQTIQDEIDSQHEKTIAEALFYASKLEIQINEQKLKPSFQTYLSAVNLKQIEKVYYGQNIVKYLNENDIIKQNTNYEQ